MALVRVSIPKSAIEECREILEEYSPEQILCELDEVGSGGFGTVLRGKHETPGVVAVKCFKVTGGPRQQTALKKKIMREYNNILQSRHENIVIVFGITKWSGSMGIVMQFCEGGNLKVLLLDESVALGLCLILRMNLNIVSGVAYIHNCGMVKRLVHGDLKPENILLTAGLVCKITDFGSAQLASYTGSTTIGASSEKQALTPYYAAPEKYLRGARPKKEQDAYSCGMIKHMTLAREEPYQSNEEFRQKIQQGDRPNCEAIQVLKQQNMGNNREIVEVVEGAMIRCWDEDPSQRPDLTTIRNEFQELLTRQDPALLAQQVADAVRGMDLHTQPFNPTVPLNQFSTEHRQFYTGGIPIVRPLVSHGELHEQEPPTHQNQDLDHAQTRDNGNTTQNEATVENRGQRRTGDHFDNDDETPPKILSAFGAGVRNTLPTETETSSLEITQTISSYSQPEHLSRFLVIGGESTIEDDFGTRCMKCDATTLRFSDFPRLHTRRVCASSVRINNKVYVMGGVDNYRSTNPHKSGEVLDLSAATTWIPMLDMLHSRKWFGCGQMGGNIYVTGGFGETNETHKRCERLDISRNEWMSISDLKHGRYGHETAVLNDSLYCFGGYDDDKQLDSCERYNPEEGQWRSFANLNQARSGFASAVVNGYIYAIGGYDGRSSLSTAERYDPTANRWEYVAPLRIDRTVTAACALGLTIQVVGGYSSLQGGTTDVIEEYETTTDTWRDFTTTEAPIRGSTVVAY